MIFKSIKKQRFYSILLVPHTSRSPFRFVLTLNFLIFSCILWTGITITATCVMGKYFRYCADRVNYKVEKFQMTSLLSNVKSYREYLYKVQEKDKKLRQVLTMAQEPKTTLNGIMGGPLSEDKAYLDSALGKKAYEMTINDLSYQVNSLKQELNSKLSSIDEIQKNVVYQRALYRAMPNLSPCNEKAGSGFGMRIHPFTKEYEFHEGVDMGGYIREPIYASADGIVKVTGWVGNYGNLVVIDHGFGYQTRYGHLSKILVTLGQRVKRGQKIALMGDTGRATCVHLHYEVRCNDKILNPSDHFNKDIYFSKSCNLMKP